MGKEIVLPDFELFKREPTTPTEETSFLIGAGFSANKGYPTASELNER